MDKVTDFFYSNSSVSGYSPVDFTMVFQRRGIPTAAIPSAPIIAPKTQTTEILDRIDVSLAPGHMKVLVASVIETLLAFEVQHGTIRLSNTDQALFDGAIGKLGELNKR